MGSSELLLIECHRVLDRYRLEGQLSDEDLTQVKQELQYVTDGLTILELSESVRIRAAGPFPTIIGTLDALHVASLLLWKEAVRDERVLLFSADQQMRTCAGALGIEVSNDR